MRASLCSVHCLERSLVGTWAMFKLRGIALRLAMVLVAASGCTKLYNSWWQMIANPAPVASAMLGAWGARRAIRRSKRAA